MPEPIGKNPAFHDFSADKLQLTGEPKIDGILKLIGDTSLEFRQKLDAGEALLSLDPAEIRKALPCLTSIAIDLAPPPLLPRELKTPGGLYGQLQAIVSTMGIHLDPDLGRVGKLIRQVAVCHPELKPEVLHELAGLTLHQQTLAMVDWIVDECEAEFRDNLCMAIVDRARNLDKEIQSQAALSIAKLLPNNKAIIDRFVDRAIVTCCDDSAKAGILLRVLYEIQDRFNSKALNNKTEGVRNLTSHVGLQQVALTSVLLRMGDAGSEIVISYLESDNASERELGLVLAGSLMTPWEGTLHERGMQALDRIEVLSQGDKLELLRIKFIRQYQAFLANEYPL